MAINAWEKRKLASLVHFIGTGKSTFTLHPSKDKIFRFPVLGSTSIIGYDSSYDVEGKMILTARVGANAGNLYIYSGKAKITDNTVFLVTDTPSFLKALLDHFDLKKIKFGTGQPLIKASELKRLKLFVPCDPTELDSIQDCVLNINNLIAATQGKLDQLQMVKKALLQHFFDQSMRFKGYSDPWEKCKLGDIAEKVTEKNKSGEFKEVLTNSAENGIVSQRDFFDKDIANKESLSGYYVVRPDDFVYNPRISNSAPVGPIKRNRLKRIGIMSPLYFVFRVHGVNHGFLEQYFLANVWHRFMTRNGDTGARSDRFAIKDSVFVTMPILIPSVAEQQHIASSLQTLDGLIAAAQSKLVGYRQLKKSLLQELFV
ncbi:restriction endonuclease subunit S [Lacticaseibacillus huelsenbergensis]|uniref:restriction endonuclease subunit S n=1 Tax=Lacticaseibacillus huelsenbergensis TaxID=3035291 RepID=UPI002434157C|nr:restriction endonuclease subunit S [Lacticaseibacillus huelsenbergensis]WFB43443.1 restriction endonuclease subunit S [Lacticaseibacillus huelsenbergensis]